MTTVAQRANTPAWQTLAGGTFVACLMGPGVAAAGAMLGLLTGLVLRAATHRSVLTNDLSALAVAAALAVATVWAATAYEVPHRGRFLMAMGAGVGGWLLIRLTKWESPVREVIAGCMALFAVVWLLTFLSLALVKFLSVLRSRANSDAEEVADA